MQEKVHLSYEAGEPSPYITTSQGMFSNESFSCNCCPLYELAIEGQAFPPKL